MILKTAGLLYLTLISIYDLRTLRIPNFLTYGFFALLFAHDIFTAPSEIPGHMLSAFFFFALFFLAAILTKGIGFGDVKLAAVLGYSCGILRTSVMLVFACTAAVAAFIILRIRKSRVKRLPFSPFVAAGYVISGVLCRRFA